MIDLVFAELAYLIGGKIESIEKTYPLPEDALHGDAVYGLKITVNRTEVREGVLVTRKVTKVLWILSDFEGNGAGGFSIEDFV